MPFQKCLTLMLLIATGLSFASCTTGNNPAGAPVAQLTFENVQSIPVRVAMMEMVDRSIDKRDSDDRSDDFITPPVIALEHYFKRRFNPSAFDGSLRVVVDQAGTLVTPAPKPEGWLDNLTNWTSQDIYTLSMTVILEASNGNATELKLHRQEAMPPNPSLAERETFLQNLLESVIADLDVATVKAMDRTLGILAIPAEQVQPLKRDILPAPAQAGPAPMAAPQPTFQQQPIDTTRPQPVVDDPYAPVVEPLAPPENWGEQYQ